MKRLQLAFVTVVALAFPFASLAAGPVLVCKLESMMFCGDDGKCEPKPVRAKDASYVLVFDFAAMKASFRRGQMENAWGDIVDDRTEGGRRTFAVKDDQASERVPLVLEGQIMTGNRKYTTGGSVKSTYRCAPAR